jgi:hypothetical protein
MANGLFVHQVYFWLANPESVEDRAKLIDGLQKLSKVEGIRMSHIGQPAETDRAVIDRSYSISWLTLFDTQAAQDAYQEDPIHLRFVEECASLWSKVIVYDSTDV